MDSPGIIPASLEDQSDALLLAACHCIGEASYDNQVVASYLCQWMQNLMITGKDAICAPGWRDNCRVRWGIDPLKPVPIETPVGFENDDENAATTRYITGEELLYMVADNKCKGSPEDASRKILQDFRSGRMGDICLQLAPTPDSLDNNKNDSNNFAGDFSQVPDPRMGTMRTEGMASDSYNDWERRRDQQEAEAQQRANNARDLAKERGLELPPLLENPSPSSPSAAATAAGDSKKDKNSNKQTNTEDVGKGLFDGW